MDALRWDELEQGLIYIEDGPSLRLAHAIAADHPWRLAGARDVRTRWTSHEIDCLRIATVQELSRRIRAWRRPRVRVGPA